MALLLAAVTVHSLFENYQATLSRGGMRWCLNIWFTRVSFSRAPDIRYLPNGDFNAGIYSSEWLMRPEPEKLLWAEVYLAPDRDRSWLVGVPMWYFVLPSAVLAIAGFRLKRREPKPGQCQHCRHPLAGAAVCPECGTGAAARVI